MINAARLALSTLLSLGLLGIVVDVADAQEECFICQITTEPGSTPSCNPWAIRGYTMCQLTYYQGGRITCAASGDECEAAGGWSARTITPDGTFAGSERRGITSSPQDLGHGFQFVANSQLQNGTEDPLGASHQVRGCGGVIVARHYSRAAAAELRRGTASITI
ncbi:MAG TPA: hypothetical protein VHG28_03955 [Longimicrobiaceae bacterium]|nr:hypothetical protein [Longimicrobiaceae bacterium]